MNPVIHFIAVGIALAPAPAQTVVSVDPRATYLHTSNDPAQAAPALPLASIPGAVPGAWLCLQRRGAWDNGPGPDIFESMGAVFSRDAILLPPNPNNIQRVPGALPCCSTFITPPSWRNAQPTDVDEDFWISRDAAGPAPYADSVHVRIPAAATHLFVTVADNLFSDNSDPNGDLELVITVVLAPTHPGTSEDIELRTGVSAQPTADPDVKTARAGDTISAQVVSRFGTTEGDLYVLLLDTFATGTATPVGPFPATWFGLTATTEAVGILTPFPATWTAVVPPGIAGTSAILQAGALSALARNGLFVASDAHEIRITP